MTLSNDELKRYLRHFSLDEIGIEGQTKLKNGRVLCIGAGGLGSPLLLYLAAAGVGTLGVIDHDQIDITNLQRQVLFDSTEIGASKAEQAKKKLLKLNPNINVICYSEKLSEENVFNIFPEYNIIADCTDNFPTRYLVNDACFHLKKPNVFACISRFEGQCTIFCAEGGPCYRCLFRDPPPEGLIPNCAEAGVLGVLPGLLGVIQATEVIKMLLGIGKPLINRLLMLNALDMNFREFTLQKDQDCYLCAHQTPFDQLSRIQTTCQIQEKLMVEEITVQELKKLKEQKKEVFILDVREPYEYEICNMGGHLIPMGELPNRLSEIPNNREIVVHCKGGGRSRRATEFLKQSGFQHVVNLKGGMISWIDEIEPNLVKY